MGLFDFLFNMGKAGQEAQALPETTVRGSAPADDSFGFGPTIPQAPVPQLRSAPPTRNPLQQLFNLGLSGVGQKLDDIAGGRNIDPGLKSPSFLDPLTGEQQKLTEGILPSGKSIAQGLGIMGGLGLVGQGVLTVGSQAVGGPRSPSPLVDGPDVVDQMAKDDTEMKRLLHVRDGLIPAGPGDEDRIKLLEQKEIKHMFQPKENESDKERLARITGSDPKNPHVTQEVLGKLTSLRPDTQQGIGKSLQDLLGVEFQDLQDRSGVKFMDDVLNQAQDAQQQRLAGRGARSERIRQLQQKLEHPETMSKGEKIAFGIATALPLLAAVVSKKRASLQALGQFGQAIDQRRGQLQQINQQNFDNLLKAESQLDQFDSRTIQNFATIGNVIRQREALKGQRISNIDRAIDTVSAAQKLSAPAQEVVRLADLSEGKLKAGGLALRAEISNNILKDLESEYQDFFASSGTRFARFKLSDYVPFTEGVAKLELANELVPPELRRLLSAQMRFMQDVLRKKSGATIKESEFLQFENAFFIFPGDDENTIADKRRGRLGEIASFKTEATPQGVKGARDAMIMEILAEPVGEMGGRIVVKEGRQFIMVPDKAGGGVRYADAEKFFEAIRSTGILDETDEKELDRLIRGL